MQILKAINNNVVSCMDAAGQELVVMGRGLGFNARPGEAPDPAKIEKIFRMENQQETDRLKHLLASLPPEQIELCTRIIAYATETLNKRLNENVYLTLTDHVCFAISRKQQGACFENELLPEVRTFYPGEFAVGRYALTLIEQELGVSFPDDEAASIALHLVNAEYGTPFSDTMHRAQALHDMVAALHRFPELGLREDSSYYDELIIHLKFLALRAFSGEAEPPREDALVRMVSVSYPQEYACAQRLLRLLEQAAERPFAPEQAAYLTLYIHRAARLPENKART